MHNEVCWILQTLPLDTHVAGSWPLQAAVATACCPIRVLRQCNSRDNPVQSRPMRQSTVLQAFKCACMTARCSIDGAGRLAHPGAPSAARAAQPRRPRLAWALVCHRTNESLDLSGALQVRGRRAAAGRPRPAGGGVTSTARAACNGLCMGSRLRLAAPTPAHAGLHLGAPEAWGGGGDAGGCTPAAWAWAGVRQQYGITSDRPRWRGA